MALTLSYDAHSEIGLVRTTNQDSAYVSPTMLMVADGMGGAAAGDLASAIATWELERTDAELDARVAAARAEREASGEPVPTGEDEPGELVDVLTVLASTLARANDRLIERVEDDPGLAGMGTTVCGFVLADDRLAVVNIGDSRAYLVRDGSLHRVTRDHSWVQSLVDEGRISEEEALEHPHKNLVLKVLNGAAQHEPDLGWLDIRVGDRLMICSDGLCGLVTDAAMAPVLTAGLPRGETIDRLVGLAHAAGGHDNITIVLADVEDGGPAGAPRRSAPPTASADPTAPSTPCRSRRPTWTPRASRSAPSPRPSATRSPGGAGRPRGSRSVWPCSCRSSPSSAAARCGTSTPRPSTSSARRRSTWRCSAACPTGCSARTSPRSSRPTRTPASATCRPTTPSASAPRSGSATWTPPAPPWAS
ncbi:PP2C family protein-serine/threonine phosphatase [Propioniciclava coleopterorum]|nr:protein phosphatase 2C domain-containing protein [Propioniciclava coleopterorum]